MSIVVSYEQQPPRRPTYASTAQKHPKLEMPQDMKHYEALLAITQALGMRHPKPRSLQPHPEMRQGFSLLIFSFDFSLLISLSDDQWDSGAGLGIKILAWKQRPAESGRGRLSHGVATFKFRMPVPTLRAESLLLYEMSAVPRHDQNEKQCRLQKAVNAFPEWPLVEIIEVIHSVFGLECRNVRRCRFCKLEVCETPSVGTIRPFAWLRNMMSVPLFARAATNLPSARYHIVA
jgi:hypothetical protein